MANSNGSYNKTIIIGRLGQDPELSKGAKTEVARFSLCNSQINKDGTEETQWHKICAFGKQATLCADHLHKGDLCCIEGRLDNRSYEVNGQKKYYHSIIAERITFLSKRRQPQNPSHNASQDDLNIVFP